jgi:hypothetical protein
MHGVSTTIQRSFYRNGQMREETPMRNGRRHGVVRTWHKNGVLASEESYQDGQLHGICRQWDEQGKLLGKYRMHHGTGIQRVWFENGVLQLEHSLVNGAFTGLSRLWFQDGALATEQLLVKNREVTSAKYAKEAAGHPEWPRYSTNGNVPRKLSPAVLEKRAFRLHCEWLAHKPTTRDATEWLSEAKATARAVGSLSAGRARKLVSDALAAGARKVLAADTYASKQGKQFADVLLIELPKSKSRRAAIRKLFAALPRRTKSAVQPDRDGGEPWLYVYFG